MSQQKLHQLVLFYIENDILNKINYLINNFTSQKIYKIIFK